MMFVWNWKNREVGGVKDGNKDLTPGGWENGQLQSNRKEGR